MNPRAALLLATLLAILVAGCGGNKQASEPTHVVLVTHDSFAVSKPVKAAFERQTGLKLRILETGDAGIALNRALLTKGNPEGDVFFPPLEATEWVETARDQRQGHAFVRYERRSTASRG